MKLTAKDIAQRLCVSNTTAYRYLNDIKRHFNTKIVTEHHYKSYFNIP